MQMLKRRTVKYMIVLLGDSSKGMSCGANSDYLTVENKRIKSSNELAIEQRDRGDYD
jgi:hypothetical protein